MELPLRFVSVRGIAPDLNSVTINGTLVPSPESDRRAVALDVLPSELVQSLSVQSRASATSAHSPLS